MDAEGVADDVEALEALVVVDEEEVAGLGAAGRGTVGLAATGREEEAVGCAGRAWRRGAGRL